MSKKAIVVLLLVVSLVAYGAFIGTTLHPYFADVELETSWEQDFGNINISQIRIGDEGTVFVVSDGYGVIAISPEGREIYRFQPNKWRSYRDPDFSFDVGEADSLWVAYMDVVAETVLAGSVSPPAHQIPLPGSTSTGGQTSPQARTLVTRLVCYDKAGVKLVDQIYDIDIDGRGNDLWLMAGNVYITNRHGDLYCFDRQGNLLWTKNFPSMLGSLKGDDQLLLYCSKDLVGLSPDGKELWRDSKGWGVGFDQGKNWSTTEARSCMLGYNGEFHIIDNGGQELWSQELNPTSKLIGNFSFFIPDKKSPNYGIPAVRMHHDGTVYALSSSAVVNKYSAEGKQLWSFSGGSSVNGFDIGPDGTVYLLTYTRGLMAINANRKLLWRDERFGKSFLAPKAGSNGMVFLEQNDKLIALRIPDYK